MGIFKFIISLFSCKSSCKFNNNEYNIDFHNKSLSQFKLKNKDVVAIHKILAKRKLHIVNFKDITDSDSDSSIYDKRQRPDTPYPKLTSFKESSI